MTKQNLEQVIRLCSGALAQVDHRNEEQEKALSACYKVMGLIG